MLYQSKLDEIWIKLINGGAERTIKGPVPSRATYLQVVCMMFCQPEEGPSPERLPVDIKSYLVERRLWVYYCEFDLQGFQST